MRAAALVASLLAALPSPAMAHSAVAGVDSFTSGLLHPFVVPAHLLAIVGLGGLLSLREFDRARPAIYAFIAGLLAGLAAAAAGFVGALPASLLLGATAALGLATALAAPGLAWAAIPLGGFVALAIGLDSAPDGGALEDRVGSLLGTGIAVVLLLLNVLAAALYLTKPWQRVGIRVLGSWIAASALLVLALGLRGGT